MINCSGKSSLHGLGYEQLELHSGEGRIRRMAVTLPVAGIPVHLEISGFFPTLFERKTHSLEIRSGLAIPLSEMNDLHHLASSRSPMGAIGPTEEPSLNLNLAEVRWG